MRNGLLGSGVAWRIIAKSLTDAAQWPSDRQLGHHREAGEWQGRCAGVPPKLQASYAGSERVILHQAMLKVIFACVHNAGRSQMAAAFFNQLADPQKAHALSAGTEPGERVHPEVQAVMREVGIDLSDAKPRKFTEELTQGSQLLITMGCGEQCPHVPGLRRDDWPLRDPKGRPIEEVRAIRDEVKRRVEALLKQEQL
ncbi:MAG TPA: arsenate reductase ArsC [Terriglobales bacterium]|nr:arsenate reductase ArsC [Terriglobales bacterium]